MADTLNSKIGPIADNLARFSSSGLKNVDALVGDTRRTMKTLDEAINRLDVILPRDKITASYAPGELRRIVQHDGSILHLHKLAEHYDPSDRVGAMAYLQARQALGEIVTGLIYVEAEATPLHENLGTVPQPLNALGDAELCPGVEALARLNAAMRAA